MPCGLLPACTDLVCSLQSNDCIANPLDPRPDKDHFLKIVFRDRHSTNQITLTLWHAGDHGSGMGDPPAGDRPSHSQAGTGRLRAIAPILKRRRAAPTAPPHPHSPPALGPIPFRTASTNALGPMLASSTLDGQAARDCILHPSESCMRDADQEEEEEGDLEGRAGSVGAVATQSTRLVLPT